ncbi:apolipoprotein N-acyltransferase [Geminisphaera colitermitum]|uniref:apolipoprotein N-acyltransferase n=1 Tax=Geminisphaera colitermitum TaxID=1148786 RepID=UPI000693EFBB|nr:apolipoprotein N-acyltransferase [Geminisphaera colitermitum]
MSSQPAADGNNASPLSSSLPPPPPPPSPWWRRHADTLIALIVFAATCAFTILMAPPGRAPEAAYIFAGPAIFWAYRRPAWRPYLFATLGSQVVAWTVILGWLHHVTWLGLFLLGPVIGLWVGAWFAAARWVMPRMIGRPTITRLLAMLGLAGVWVIIEWTRTWLLSGFPWLPLAATQWQRISILQIASYTGATGVSFVLIVVNIGAAAYAHRLLCETARGLARRSQEFLAALFLLLVCLAVFVPEAINRGRHALPLGRFAIVQPAIPQTLKWDPDSASGIEQILVDQTLAAARATPRPDVIFWPEASTPWAARGDPRTQAWIEQLARQTGVPLVLGSIIIQKPKTPEEAWFNGALAVDPRTGLQDTFYAKRKLVPFGEYVPFRSLIGWIDKFVPIGGDFDRGSIRPPPPPDPCPSPGAPCASAP